MDYFSNEELLENYRNTYAYREGLQHIDYVVKEKKYKEVINEKFDLIYSSHNIEHLPCLINGLNNWSDILNENGLVFLGIPDYSYVFDRYKNPTTIFDVLRNYYEKVKKPPPFTILESKYLNAHNDTGAHWREMPENRFHLLRQNEDFFNSKIETIVNDIKEIEELYLNNEKYIDSHCWKFSPWNFKNIMDIIYKSKLCNLKLIRCYNTIQGHNEFFAILQKISHN